jgi:1-acyl-sn-glycerol-3-phosphate acyltransferase
VIVTLRVLCRGTWLVLHIAVAFPIMLLCFRRPRPDSRLQRGLFRWWLAGVCRILRVQVVMQGRPQSGGLVVANHVSWLDIPVLASVWHGAFLAKAEVGDWPLIGWLVRHAGTVLIRRRSADSLGRAVGRMCGHMRRGGGVCMFPEGTTTDGRGLRRFQPRLFEAAIAADARVQPVALRYVDADGQRHPVAPFIGDDDFVSHLLRLLRGPPLRAELVFLPPLAVQGKPARALAELARAQVGEAMAGRLCHAADPRMPAIGDAALSESPCAR